MSFEIPYHRPLGFPVKMLIDNISDITISGQLTNGKYCRLLEDKVKEMYGVKHAIVTANGTMGLALCYMYFKTTNPILFLPNYTWISVHLTALELGFREMFLDINKDSWLVDIYPNKGLVSPNHTFGNVATIDREREVVFDGAHAFGCKLNNIGDATVFSFAATKIITACEGGCIITNNDYLADFVSYRRDKMARMSELHAAYCLQTLPYLDKVKAFKKECFDYYKLHIPGIFQTVPLESNYNTIGFLNINKLIIPKEIETKQYYEPAYQVDLLPNAYYVYQNIICLPSYYDCNYKEITKRILEANK